MMQIYPQTAPVHQLQKGYRSLLNKTKQIKGPLFLLKNNKPESVLLDFCYWQDLTDLVLKLEKADLEDSILSAQKAIENNQIKELSSLKDLID